MINFNFSFGFGGSTGNSTKGFKLSILNTTSTIYGYDTAQTKGSIVPQILGLLDVNIYRLTGNTDNDICVLALGVTGTEQYPGSTLMDIYFEGLGTFQFVWNGAGNRYQITSDKLANWFFANDGAINKQVTIRILP